MKKIKITLLTTYCFLFSYSFSQKMGSIKDDIIKLLNSEIRGGGK